MNNLFSTFDPASWLNLNLNWFAALLILMILPPTYWLSPSQGNHAMMTLITSVTQEFKSILSLPSPGILLLPVGLFCFILFNNSLGLIPYIFTASSHLSFTISLALPLWVGHMLLATLKTPTLVLAHLVPLGTPPVLMPLMVLIELVSSVIRPLTLSVRLAANMIAGHLLLALLGGVAPHLALAPLLALLIGLVLLGVLECAVSMIQAYVFSALSTLYLNEVNSSQLN